MSKRVFLIVLDSFGIGEADDAELFSDNGADTLGSVCSSDKLNIPTMQSMGLFNIDGISVKGREVSLPCASYGKLRELSSGKDTTIGHWEISGIVSNQPLPTFPNGFPDEIIEEFSIRTGRKVLCNKPYSGTKVINDYGQQHIDTGALIVYTSADSVFQIAAHENVIPLQKLYEYCKTARSLLTGKYGVGRVIARPFIGENGNFTRTANRHDFSLSPPQDTMLDYISRSGFKAISIGKIYDIFAGRGTTEYQYTKDNADGMNAAMQALDNDFQGLCFVNLVDFDMLYGHRRDVDGYATALSDFDNWLSGFIPRLSDDDMLIITADHGCDPTFTKTTDHTREFVLLLVYGKNIRHNNLGTLNGFNNIGKSVCDYLGCKNNIDANGFLGEIYG